MFVEIYTKQGCPECEATKQLLDSRNQEYSEYVIGQTIARSDVLEKFPWAKVAPIVVVDGQVKDPFSLRQLLNE